MWKESAFLYPFLLVVTIIVLNTPRGIYDTPFLHVFSMFMTLPFSIILSLSIVQDDMMEAGHFREELHCHFWEKRMYVSRTWNHMHTSSWNLWLLMKCNHLYLSDQLFFFLIPLSLKEQSAFVLVVTQLECTIW